MRYSSVFLGLLFLAMPMYVSAAALININTADVALLDTLPGIGASKAQAIVDYRTQNGLFLRIEDIQKVSGIGNGVTYANIAPLITVGDTLAVTTGVAPSTPTMPTVASAQAYVPPPSAISIEVTGSDRAILEVPMRLTARVTTKGGGVDSLALVRWSFGDGSSGEGAVVEKTYHYAGTYLVVATATDGDAHAQADITVTVKPAIVHIASISVEGITLANDSSDRLDLSGWRILASGGAFRIPEGMIILPGASIMLPTTVTNLPIGLDATLLFPNGLVASQYAPTVQLAVADESYKQVGGVANSPRQSDEASAEATSPIISTKVNIPVHAEAVLAPTEAVKTDSVGAPSPTASAQTAAVANAPASGIFHSTWTLGLLGVIILAGGAFILL